ncbi:MULTISPECIES: hypothetical protein [Nitrosomonas]|uniref:Uncharacterized protein n=1 Tax=Nitrosomonas communis TaxID=44574 RepID=A0A0F7KES5_9PROT|nr:MULTISPECIES: hypothetical protein [Nitrosomonas]AKH37342.1 hypothetical protein AAW31_05215 [Nitrosomonas communis]TYP74183.1 hypothetical protein BCL69_109013 [Nitrosomonas communis]UVS62558.1 hypothetical protein NX761_05405 [Nitrosomonas sp. PLL12]
MKKEQVRQQFPQACKLADEVRAVFGDDLKLVYLKEGERELGTPSTEGMAIGGITGDMWVDKKKGVRNDDH